MGKLDEFFRLLEITVRVIYCDGEIKRRDELREYNNQWRWFVTGAWLGMNAWMFSNADVASVGTPEDWREYEDDMERPAGNCFPLS